MRWLDGITDSTDMGLDVLRLEAAQGAPRDPRRDSRGERSPWLPLPAILIPACVSSSPAFLMMYSAYKLNKQGDNIQP